MTNKISCIYIIYNKENKKYYIGSTQQFNKRKKRHISRLKSKTHSNYYLQNDFDKHYKKIFKFAIIKEVSVDKLLDIEQKYLDLLQPDYNIATDVQAAFRGRKHTEEVKQKISESHKGKIFSKEHKEKIRKRTSGFNHGNCNFTKKEITGIWEEIVKGEKNDKEIAEKYNASRSQISKIRKKDSWKNVTDNLKGRASSSPSIYNKKLNRKQVIKIYDLIYNSNLSQTAISEKFGISSSLVSKIKNQKRWKEVTKNIVL